jgi:hypothetical protein
MRLQATVFGQMHLGVVYVVLSALAVELYLKCLLAIQVGQYPETHNLKTLFGQLPAHTRGPIKKRHDKEASEKTPDDPVLVHNQILGNLDSLLEECQDAFTLGRYLFEPGAVRKMRIFGLRIFERCLRDFILNIHPEWTSGESTSQSQ